MVRFARSVTKCVSALGAKKGNRVEVEGVSYYVVRDAKQELFKHEGRALVRLDQVGSPKVPRQRGTAHVVVDAMVGGTGGVDSRSLSPLFFVELGN